MLVQNPGGLNETYEEEEEEEEEEEDGLEDEDEAEDEEDDPVRCHTTQSHAN